MTAILTPLNRAGSASGSAVGVPDGPAIIAAERPLGETVTDVLADTLPSAPARTDSRSGQLGHLMEGQAETL